jgi:hypothetical protein
MALSEQYQVSFEVSENLSSIIGILAQHQRGLRAPALGNILSSVRRVARLRHCASAAASAHLSCSVVAPPWQRQDTTKERRTTCAAARVHLCSSIVVPKLKCRITYSAASGHMCSSWEFCVGLYIHVGSKVLAREDRRQWTCATHSCQQDSLRSSKYSNNLS